MISFMDRKMSIKLQSNKILSILVIGILLASCSKKSFETPVVVIPTDLGLVSCQLYTPSLTMWDEAVDHPIEMSKATADGFCKGAGVKQARYVQ